MSKRPQDHWGRKAKPEGFAARSVFKLEEIDRRTRLLRPGMRVLLPPGCGDPRAVVAEICRQSARLAPLTLMGGLRLDDYPFAAPAHAGRLRFATWHHSPRLRDADARGDVDFVPARYWETPTAFAEGGPWRPDAVIVHAAPPDRDRAARPSWSSSSLPTPACATRPTAHTPPAGPVAPSPSHCSPPRRCSRGSRRRCTPRRRR